ncbi:MAG: Thiol:disulfide interchange protein DsbD [Syntrophorhabdaceae bacterium PtaU1.Bin034]|nr:MAG: Thiol:disulfide interchange protein DsbD [Syntrophorhabdaceae bacterium PtaU1.Bin034]
MRGWLQRLCCWRGRREPQQLIAGTFGTIIIVMKKLMFALFVTIMLVASSVYGQDYESALKTAKKENKPLVLYFVSRGCGYCNLMDRNTMADREIDAILKKDFVFLRIDADKSDLSRLYRITGTPSSWFLESSGKRIFEAPGYIQKPLYKKVLEYVKDKHYNEMDLQTFLKKTSDRK